MEKTLAEIIDELIEVTAEQTDETTLCDILREGCTGYENMDPADVTLEYYERMVPSGEGLAVTFRDTKYVVNSEGKIEVSEL